MSREAHGVRVTAVEIAGLGSAQPPFMLEQSVALEHGLRLLTLGDSARDLFCRIMRADGVETRRLGIADVHDLLETSHEKKLERFERWGVQLSASALDAALRSAGVDASQVDLIAITTCTGYLCPGLSAYVAEACRLKPDVRRLDIVGMGCGAALPALEQAAAFVRADPAAVAAVVCTEISSAAILTGDAPDLIVSNAIFADGSAAAILRARDGAAGKTGPAAGPVPGHGCRPAFVAFRSLLLPEWRNSLRFRTEGGHLRNVLAREVPILAGDACRTLIHQLLDEQGLKPEDIDHWVLHAGGKAVLDKVSRRLRLAPEHVRSAREVLRTSGNMSSPTVLFVLMEEHRRRPPRPGERAVVTSFGAGFAAHAALVEYQ